MAKENELDPEVDHVMDFERLKQLTGKSYVDISAELGVDKSYITSSNKTPKSGNKIIVAYLAKFDKILPLKELFKKAPEKQKNK